MPKAVTCNSCDTAMPEGAQFCPQCGIGQTAVNATIALPEFDEQKLKRKLRALERKVSEFNTTFDEDALEDIEDVQEFLPLIQTFQTIEKKIASLQKQLDALNLTESNDKFLKSLAPGLVREIEEFTKRADILTDQIAELEVIEAATQKAEIKRLTDGVIKGDDASDAAVRKFWLINSIVTAIPAFFAMAISGWQQITFYIIWFLGLLPGWLVYQWKFVKCVHCSKYVKISVAQVGQEYLGSQSGWHTESQKTSMSTTFTDVQGRKLGYGESTGYSNRAVPHTDEFYKRALICPRCEGRWTDQVAYRISH